MKEWFAIERQSWIVKPHEFLKTINCHKWVCMTKRPAERMSHLTICVCLQGQEDGATMSTDSRNKQQTETVRVGHSLTSGHFARFHLILLFGIWRICLQCQKQKQAQETEVTNLCLTCFVQLFS